MKKRMFLMLVVVIAFLAIIGGFKFFQIKTAMAQQGSFQPPPEAVTSVIAMAEEWNTPVHAIGTVEAVNGVTVTSDLPGVVDQITFESGRTVGKGENLVLLDTKQEKAQLAAAQAQLDLSRLGLERTQDLVDKKIVSRETYDGASAQFKQAQARVAELRATIERKTIRAPFTGVLGIREVNLGQYLASGAPIVSLQSIRPVYANFTVPEQEIGRLDVGSAVQVTSDAIGGAENGRITAFDSTIDAATRNIRIQAEFDNRSGKLKPGMFVEAQLSGRTRTTAVTIPASSISYAPFGDSVFIVEEVKPPQGKSYLGVRQQFVKLGAERGDQVAVLTGVKPGEQVVTSGVFKLRPGAPVQVNNAIQPGNSAKPKPEDN
jgi:membrane fusion protein (multidrug efflux system)